jgi:PAS domain-containing protein
MKTLGQSEETYRLLVESMPGIVWLGRSDGFIEYLTPHALDYLGLPAKEVCGLGSSPIRDTSGRIVGASKIACDMSGRKRAERILQEGRERFEGVIESAMDAIISVDENQRVVLFNTAAGRMFRCAASEALGNLTARLSR